MTKKLVDEAMLMNNATFVNYLNRLKVLSTSIFHWKNLDKVCGYGAERFLEDNLYEYGRACFVNDDEIGLKTFRANPRDKLNIYNLPTKIQATALGYNKPYDLNDIVYIMNNSLTMPTRDTIFHIAYKLYEIERTEYVNLIAQKTPVLIEGPNKSQLTLKNLYMQYSGNTPFIFGNKDFELNNHLNVLKTEAPYLLDKLNLYKREVWSEALTYLGIDNFFTSKKERVVTDEVKSNDDLTSYYLNVFYKPRQEACDLFNEKFKNEAGFMPISLTVNKEAIAQLKDEMGEKEVEKTEAENE